MKSKLKVIELSILDRFRKDLFRDNSPETVEKQLNWYLKSFEGLNFKFAYDRPIIRARLCSSPDGFNHISELQSPPPEVTDIGRMNEKGNPMFYASYHIGSAFAEINAKEGDIVQVTQFKLPNKSNSGIRCLAIGEVYNAYHGNSTISQSMFDEIRKFIERLGKSDIRGLLSYLYMDALSAELLNDTSASENDYIYSRTLSRLLLEKHPRVDGLVFPSAKMKGTANITLRPESVLNKVKVVSSQVLKITKLYPYGLCDFELLKQSKGESLDGHIHWQKN
ncbi:RES domain-containing protein [Neptunomonas phycophila]|uniref:RES domain-containing protein n=1 Tax=Neptunomonas phycophila TaxID=1572645 RepID=UPI00094904F0|nr:RES domain-containing protein [Neptunomonas phycophila]